MPTHALTGVSDRLPWCAILLALATAPGCSESPPPGGDSSDASGEHEDSDVAGPDDDDDDDDDATSTASSTSGSTPGSSATSSTTAGDTTGTTSTTAETLPGDSSTESGDSTTTTGEDPSALAMRTVCPDAPPAGPVMDPERNVSNLTVPKDTYRTMITPQEPFQGTRGTLPWNLYEPEQGASPDGLYPLVLVLHGGYGREVDEGNILVDAAQYLLGSANGLLTEANLQQYPTYIVAPHCIESEGCVFGTNEWSSAGGAFYQVQPQPSIAGETAIELVESLLVDYPIDPARIYVTGNSMGGGGTWEFVQRRPDLFAAGVPVAGHTPSLADLDGLAISKVPVWAFTGADDYVNSNLDTDEAVQHVLDGGGCAWVTKYAATGHDDVLWANPYLDAGLWPWLFAQKIPRVGEPGAGDPFP